MQWESCKNNKCTHTYMDILHVGRTRMKEYILRSRPFIDNFRHSNCCDMLPKNIKIVATSTNEKNQSMMSMVNGFCLFVSNLISTFK